MHEDTSHQEAYVCLNLGIMRTSTEESFRYQRADSGTSGESAEQTPGFIDTRNLDCLDHFY